jgi:glycosyltransferase involved in cell wall biosynthesis
MPLPENVNSVRQASIAGVVLTYNNESIIARFLNSIAWMDRVIIVDSFSTDRTLDLVRTLRPDAQIVQRTLDSFAAQRNVGLELAQTDWIMHFDSDMVVPPELRDEIVQHVLRHENGIDVYRMSLREFFRDRPTHNFSPIVHTLHRKGKAYWDGSIDETMIVSGKIGHLQHPLDHYGVPSFEYMIKKINHYSQKKAERYGPMERHSLRMKIRTVIMPIRLFLRIYVTQKSHKDGWYGFLYASIRAFNLFLSFAKMWELQQLQHIKMARFENSSGSL